MNVGERVEKERRHKNRDKLDGSAVDSVQLVHLLVCDRSFFVQKSTRSAATPPARGQRLAMLFPHPADVRRSHLETPRQVIDRAPARQGLLDRRSPDLTQRGTSWVGRPHQLVGDPGALDRVTDFENLVAGHGIRWLRDGEPLATPRRPRNPSHTGESLLVIECKPRTTSPFPARPGRAASQAGGRAGRGGRHAPPGTARRHRTRDKAGRSPRSRRP